jgi:hypothetical protein
MSPHAVRCARVPCDGRRRSYAMLLVASLCCVLFRAFALCYPPAMIDPVPLIEDDEDAAEARALAAAAVESDADPRTAPHDEVRVWLLRIANGEFDVPPPEPR